MCCSSIDVVQSQCVACSVSLRVTGSEVCVRGWGLGGVKVGTFGVIFVLCLTFVLVGQLQLSKSRDCVVRDHFGIQRCKVCQNCDCLSKLPVSVQVAIVGQDCDCLSKLIVCHWWCFCDFVPECECDLICFNICVSLQSCSVFLFAMFFMVAVIC